MSTRPIRSGDVLHLTRAASPQFVCPITVRVIREVADRHTYHGWTWIEAYELSPAGDAVRRRELFVLVDGVRHQPQPLPRHPGAPRRPIARTPAKVGA